MPQETLLIAISQLAVIFTGFVAIFLVYVRQDGRFSPADSLRIASIIFIGFAALFASLGPLALWSFGVSENDVWQFAAIVWAVLASPTAYIIARRQIAMTPEDRKEVGYIHTTISWSMFACVAGLTAYVALGFGGPGEYILALIMCLAIATTNFVTISLQKLL